MKIKNINNRKLGILNLMSLLIVYVWKFIYGMAVSNTHESFHALGESIYSLIFSVLLVVFLLAISVINFFIAIGYKKEQRKRISKMYIANSLLIFFVATQRIIFRLMILLRDTITKMLNRNETIVAFDTVANFINIIVIICYILIFILNIILIITKPNDKGLNKDKILRKINKTGILFILTTLFVIGTLIYSKTYLNLEDSEMFVSLVPSKESNSIFENFSRPPSINGTQVKTLIDNFVFEHNNSRLDTYITVKDSKGDYLIGNKQGEKVQGLKGKVKNVKDYKKRANLSNFYESVEYNVSLEYADNGAVYKVIISKLEK